MQHRLAFLIFAISLITLAVLQTLALTFYLYWVYLWFDIPMHFLGGVTVALGFYGIRWIANRTPKQFRGLLGTFLFAFMIGMLWELYELLFAFPLQPGYLADSLLDLVMDILGGVAGFYIARSFKVLEEE